MSKEDHNVTRLLIKEDHPEFSEEQLDGAAEHIEKLADILFEEWLELKKAGRVEAAIQRFLGEEKAGSSNQHRGEYTGSGSGVVRMECWTISDEEADNKGLRRT